MSNYIKRMITVIACAVITAVFIVIMNFAVPEIACAPETVGEISYDLTIEHDDGTFEIKNYKYVIGKDLTAVRINDLQKLNKITKVNYVADRFVPPDSLPPDVEIVDLTKRFDFADKGTLIFIVMNLDPASADFLEQAEKLSEFKIGDNFEFEFSLPKIFSASNVYLQSNLVARHGEIENYDFINFTTTYDKKTENFSELAERTPIGLKFYSRRQAMNLYQMIVVHYQSSGTVYSGLKDYPLIGMERNVNAILEKSQDLLIAFAVLTAVVFAVLMVLSLLKHSIHLIPVIIWILGIFLMMFSKYILSQSTSLPLLWSALSMSGVFLTLGGAIFTLGRDFGKIPVKYIFTALMGVGFIVAFVRPFVPFAAAQVLNVIYNILRGTGAVALMVFVGFATAKKDDKRSILEISTAAVIAVAVFASLFLPIVFPVYANSMFYLCVIAVLTSFVGIFMMFKDTEKANAYLTANLHLEVDRQVKDIKAVITERDNLLQFVSHDMKKPLQSSEPIIDALIDRETDEEQTKALKIVKQNMSRVIGNLSEIGSYARFNYIAEPSQTVDLYELCAYLFEFHQPDCNANGIILKNTVNRHYIAFVKKQGLENAVSNVILNAIEHANCKTITLSVRTEKNAVILSVFDDGKGISENVDVFGAYVSENADKGGLGLFICKNIVESMNGKLSYDSDNNGTVFHFTLLKAA